MDVDGWMETRRITEDRGVDYVLRQENRLPMPGFPVYLEGLEKDQEKEFTLTVPDDYPNKDFVGKECRFRVKVLEIKEKKLPELDDEFARSLGEGFESMEALRERVQGDLQAEAEREEEQRVQEEVVSMLVEQAKVEFSPLMMEREVDQQMERRRRALDQNRIAMEAYLSTVGKSEEELREEMRTEVRERFVRSLVLGKVAEVEEIEVASDEVDQEIESVTSRSGDNAASAREVFSSEGGRRSLENMLLTRKVLERLREIATASLEAGPDISKETQEQEKEDNEEGDPDAK
jgi:trigger factor